MLYQKYFRSLINIFLVLVRFALLVILFTLIFGLLLFSLFQIVHTMVHWSWGNWQESLSMMLLGVVVLVSIPMVVFRLYDDRSWAKHAAGWYRQRITMLFEFILAPLIAWGVLAFLVIVISITWALLLYFLSQPVLSSTASWYLIGTLAILVYSFFAQGATQRILCWVIGPPLKLPWLTYLLRPSLMRVYVYALLALAYLLSTLENFSGVGMTRVMWWEQFRPVIVEILLTYVAIDGAFVAWRDHREAPAEKTEKQRIG